MNGWPYEQFESMSDEELVFLARNEGDSDALEFLIERYRYFVRAKARSYFLIGADHEDIVQEGMIGLYKGVRDYRDERLASFKSFAEMCITRQMITAIKTATRQKHIPLNSYVSLDKPIFDDESDRTLLDVILPPHPTDPQDLLVTREEQLFMEEKMEELLSDLERKVLRLYLDGRSYQEISDDLDRHVKSIDNALQRVKKKFERHVDVKMMTS